MGKRRRAGDGPGSGDIHGGVLRQQGGEQRAGIGGVARGQGGHGDDVGHDHHRLVGHGDGVVEELEKRTDERTCKLKAWPKTPSGLSGALKRLAPNLRAAGVQVEFCREPDHQRRRIITISRSEQTGSVASTPSTPSETREKVDTNADGSDTNAELADAKSAIQDDSDGSDARIHLRSSVEPAVCAHADVEEAPTFDGYLNRQCRQCREWLPCRRVDAKPDGDLLNPSAPADK